jgi:hypothetical protein
LSCEVGSKGEEVPDVGTEVYINDSTTKLKTILFDKVQDESQINPEIALESIVDLFESSSIDTTTNEQPINLYVIYDTDVWDEYDEDETFQITMAHQTVESQVLYEYRITLIYEPSRFTGIKEFDLRFEKDAKSISDFKKKVIESPGYIKSLHSTPVRIEIIKEEI